MTGSASRIGLRQALQRYAPILVLCGLAGVPALAQDKPSLKEILGRAQSDSERKAVEDLIGKLQGKVTQPKQSTPEVTKPPLAGGEARQSEEPPAASERVDKSAAAPSSQSAVEQPATTPSQGDPTAAAAKTSSEQPAASEGRPPAEPPKVAAKPAAESADLAVQEAERKQLPSVDLEVHFEFDSAKLTPAAVETLTTLGRALIDERLSSSEFLIGGHTDAKGRADYNRRLSERRAEAVRQFLIATFAIDANRLAAKGFGFRYLRNPQQPRAAENRRVQVVNVSRQEAR